MRCQVPLDFFLHGRIGNDIYGLAELILGLQVVALQGQQAKR